MANTYAQDSYGQVLSFSTGIDLTNNTALSLEVKKPSGATDSITTGVAVSGDATDGVIAYTVTSGADLWDEDGVTAITPRVTFAAGKHESATPTEYTIYRTNQER
jgi:hypothetical protein